MLGKSLVQSSTPGAEERLYIETLHQFLAVKHCYHHRKIPTSFHVGHIQPCGWEEGVQQGQPSSWLPPDPMAANDIVKTVVITPIGLF